MTFWGRKERVLSHDGRIIIKIKTMPLLSSTFHPSINSPLSSWPSYSSSFPSLSIYTQFIFIYEPTPLLTPLLTPLPSLIPQIIPFAPSSSSSVSSLSCHSGFRIITLPHKLSFCCGQMYFSFVGP